MIDFIFKDGENRIKTRLLYYVSPVEIDELKLGNFGIHISTSLKNCMIIGQKYKDPHYYAIKLTKPFKRSLRFDCNLFEYKLNKVIIELNNRLNYKNDLNIQLKEDDRALLEHMLKYDNSEKSFRIVRNFLKYRNYDCIMYKDYVDRSFIVFQPEDIRFCEEIFIL